MPQTRILWMPRPCSLSNSSGQPPQLNVSFDGNGPSRLANSATVEPNPFGYCSVPTTGKPRIFAPSINRRTFQTTRTASAIAGTSFSCTSTTNSAVSPRDIKSGLRGNWCSLSIVADIEQLPPVSFRRSISPGPRWGGS